MTRRARTQKIVVPARELEPGDVLSTGGAVATVSVSGNDGTTIVDLAARGRQHSLRYQLIWSGQRPVAVLR
jgi:hypothetical protein